MSVSSNFFFSVLVLCKKWLSKFSSNLCVLRPPESEKTVFTKVSVCLSVIGLILDNSRQDYQIGLSLVTLYRSRRSKDKFVNQPHLTKIEKTRPFFTFSSWMRRYWFYVKNDFRNFHQIFAFWDPLSQKKRFLRKCLSVCNRSYTR